MEALEVGVEEAGRRERVGVGEMFEQHVSSDGPSNVFPQSTDLIQIIWGSLFAECVDAEGVGLDGQRSVSGMLPPEWSL